MSKGSMGKGRRWKARRGSGHLFHALSERRDLAPSYLCEKYQGQYTGTYLESDPRDY